MVKYFGLIKATMTNVLYFINNLDIFYCSTLPSSMRKRCFMIWVWILTFMVYSTYHLSRKPISVVKNVLNENCSKLVPPYPTNNSHWCDWKPFDGENSSSLLGILDSVYLFSYAFGMFFSGFIAERSQLNIFLSVGMICSGVMTAAFGVGYSLNIHFFGYYLIVQMVCGLFQSSGWPGVVTVMGNWFGKKKRGLIMGIWNSHTSVGNILGTLIAVAFLKSGWSLSFVVPGIIIIAMGIIVLFFLIPNPQDVGIQNPNVSVDSPSFDQTERLISSDSEDQNSCYLTSPPREAGVTLSLRSEEPITLLGALSIPGVVEFAISLFFSKMVSYTFLYWLPHFIFDSTSSDANESGKISTCFDLGGIVGGILAGVLSDSTGMPAFTCAIMLVAAVPMIYVYQVVSRNVTYWGNILLLLPVGLLVNGPYALITTAVSAELGTHSSLHRSAKALSTVTSIIDGTGSLGAAVGPLIAGVLTNNGNWSSVFYMMIIADIFSLLFLCRLVKKELTTLVHRYRGQSF